MSKIDSGISKRKEEGHLIHEIKVLNKEGKIQ